MNRMLRSPLWLFTFLGGVTAANWNACYAQTYDPPQRIEIEVEQDKYPYQLRLVGENGLVLLSRNDAKETGKWTITHYDTNFTQVLVKDIRLEVPLILAAVNSDGKNFYAILQSPFADKTNIANTYIINYNVLSKKIDVFSFYLAEKTGINTIALYGDAFVYTTFSGKSEEHIYLFNKKSLATNRLYEHKTAPCEFQQAYLDTIGNCLWLVTKFFESKKQTIITLTKLDEKGEIIQEKDIIVDENYYLNSCKMTRLDANQCMLIGEYMPNSKENVFITRNNNAGIFSVSIVNDEIQHIFYLEYGILEGLFSVSNRKNSPDLHSNTYIAAQTDSMMIVVADFYTPEYTHEVYSDRSMGYGVWGAPTYVASEAKLAGYRYHIAYFFIYDKSGKMQYYNTFNYNGMMLKNIKKVMRTYIDEDTYNTLYYFAFDGKLYSLINNKDQIIQPVKIEKIDPSSRFFSVNANITYNCEHWYDDCFVYYGYQRLYNRYSNSKSKKNKYVFFVNKLRYKE